MCVCEREREREGGAEEGGKRKRTRKLYFTKTDCSLDSVKERDGWEGERRGERERERRGGGRERESMEEHASALNDSSEPVWI